MTYQERLAEIDARRQSHRDAHPHVAQLKERAAIREDGELANLLWWYELANEENTVLRNAVTALLNERRRTRAMARKMQELLGELISQLGVAR